MSSPLSAFTAVPNPQMLAFMAAQSFVMMFQAGAAWQYGKRMISAKSNEEFNQLSPQMLIENLQMSMKEAIPSIEKSMNDMTPMVETIIKQYGEFAKLIINEIPPIAQNIVVQLTGTGGERPPFAKEGDDLRKFLAGLIPILPTAEARIGTGQGDRILGAQQAIKEQQNAAQLKAALARIEQFKREQVLDKPALDIPQRNIPTVHQSAIDARRQSTTQPQFKIKAGQTQILARNQLIKDIAALAERVKFWSLQGMSKNQTGTRSSYISGRQVIYGNRLRKKQTELTGLLQRYRF